MRAFLVCVMLVLVGCGGSDPEGDEPCVPSDDGAPCCDAVPEPACTGDEVLEDMVDVLGDHVRQCTLGGMLHGEYVVDAKGGAARWGSHLPGSSGDGPTAIAYYCRAGATYAHAMIESPSQAGGQEQYQGVCWEDGGERVPCYGMCDQMICDEAP